MARDPRLHLDGAIYAVTSRGGSTEPLFKDRRDYEAYLSLLREYQQRYHFKIFAYCLLPDQVRLCLEPAPGTTLSAIMHDVTARYTRYFNKRYQRSGHLFQARYKAALVERESGLLAVTACLHRLPAHLGLVPAFDQHPFTSFAAYRAPESASMPSRAEIDEVCSLLAGDERSPQAYVREVAAKPSTEIERLVRSLERKVIGSEEFAQLIRAQLSVARNDGSTQSMRTAPVPTPATATARPRMPMQAVFFTGSLAMVALVGVIAGTLYQRVTTLERGMQGLSKDNETLFRARYSLATAAQNAGTFRPAVTESVRASLAQSVASLADTQWDIRMIPSVSPAGAVTAQQDQLEFRGHRFASEAMALQGFAESNYTLGDDGQGGLAWETMQANDHGELLSWRGEWQGNTMRGVMTRQAMGRPAENFTFVGVAHPVSEAQRSEI